MLREGAALSFPLCPGGSQHPADPKEEGTAGRVASPVADGLFSQPLSWDSALFGETL